MCEECERLRTALAKERDALKATVKQARAVLSAAWKTFTALGMQDVRVLWANGKVCEECSHALCVFYREAQEAALANLGRFLQSEAKLAEAHHDIEAYRGSLGYSVSGNHDGRLTDGSSPVNGIAEALKRQLAEVQATLKAWTARFEHHLDEASKTITQMAEERDALQVTVERAREALQAWQVRLAFVGHPNEPEDWSTPVRLTEIALTALDAGKEI